MSWIVDAWVLLIVSRQHLTCMLRAYDEAISTGQKSSRMEQFNLTLHHKPLRCMLYGIWATGSSQRIRRLLGCIGSIAIQPSPNFILCTAISEICFRSFEF